MSRENARYRSCAECWIGFVRSVFMPDVARTLLVQSKSVLRSGRRKVHTRQVHGERCVTMTCHSIYRVHGGEVDAKEHFSGVADGNLFFLSCFLFFFVVRASRFAHQNCVLMRN